MTCTTRLQTAIHFNTTSSTLSLTGGKLPYLALCSFGSTIIRACPYTPILHRPKCLMRIWGQQRPSINPQQLFHTTQFTHHYALTFHIFPLHILPYALLNYAFAFYLQRACSYIRSLPHFSQKVYCYNVCIILSTNQFDQFLSVECYLIFRKMQFNLLQLYHTSLTE